MHTKEQPDEKSSDIEPIMTLTPEELQDSNTSTRVKGSESLLEKYEPEQMNELIKMVSEHFTYMGKLSGEALVFFAGIVERRGGLPSHI
ncbi:hypothetical protein [Methermicoccus shengliensis]|uniref:Uncharacterized protein n=1 Tax=Methermicoccus shengliensis TaxID=660064 RepID=A0A832RZN3_9EURY|nr:hypothetical protein [Methermicoccus shengliensis]KUK04532.1 MAG: hypothetical protein XD46_0752 [Euryarchaeota archaeon 55_53]KUK30616.1 MAG: hypothetical protein XD62_0318 [Methanosarcinales archeaon 56_1174]MDI3488165.1 hypothetical protein [Methanosarcinales archaeon]MDN5295440.1 hypothetical protein [Methanosarcinales archaeon]HIH70206.1 hypothetical protein [Methermicoccus shengliensis]